MKKIFFFIIMVISIHCVSAQQRELLAVLVFRNNSFAYPYTARYYPEELNGLLTTEFFRTNKFRLIERTRINAVILEQRFQESNLSNMQIQSLGQILGVRKIIAGESVFRNGIYSANVRMIDVQTGSIDISVSCTVNNRINMGYIVIDLNEHDMLQYLAECIVDRIMDYY